MRFKIYTSIFCILLTIASSYSFAQSAELPQTAITQAKTDANSNVSKLSWVTVGLLAGTLSVVGCIAGFNVGTHLNTEHPNDFTGKEISGMGIGCLSGGIPLLYTYIRNATPPAENFIGKSPEYVSAYTEAYKKEIKSTRLKYSALGFIASSVTLTGCIVIRLSSVVSTSSP